MAGNFEDIPAAKRGSNITDATMKNLIERRAILNFLLKGTLEEMTKVSDKSIAFGKLQLGYHRTGKILYEFICRGIVLEANLANISQE